MTKKLCCLMVGALVIVFAPVVSTPVAAAMSKQQAQKECQAMYGGPANFRKRQSTGMTVHMCVQQKIGGKN